MRAPPVQPRPLHEKIGLAKTGGRVPPIRPGSGIFWTCSPPRAPGPGWKNLSEDSRRALVALLGGSQALGNLLVANPDWLPVLNIESLQFPRRMEGFRREVEGWLKPALVARDYPGAFAELRRFRQREMLRIAARDLARLGDVVEITREISDLADVCLAPCGGFAGSSSPDDSASRIIRMRPGTGSRRNFACSAWASWADRNSITVRTWT